MSADVIVISEGRELRFNTERRFQTEPPLANTNALLLLRKTKQDNSEAGKASTWCSRRNKPTDHSHDVLSGVLLNLGHLHLPAGREQLLSRGSLRRPRPPLALAGPRHYVGRRLLPENPGKNLRSETRDERVSMRRVCVGVAVATSTLDQQINSGEEVL